MSLALLLEKYDVSTEEGLQKALNEIEKEEASVDEALNNALSRSCSLEGRLRSASQAYTKLGEVRSDALTAQDMVDKTAALARDVSAKVRQLDLARSRVAECQRRVHDLIDLQLCSAGVEAAIKAHDYETGAAHVSRFLSMDPGSVAAARARGAPDPRQAMAAAATTLRESLVRKMEEASRRGDEAGVERLFKLFPQIGQAAEGVDLLAKYLAQQAETSIRRAAVVADSSGDAAVYADAFTRVVEAGGAAVERARNLGAGAAPGLLARAIAGIQPVVCAGGRRVYNAMVSGRKLAAGVGAGGAARTPRDIEPTLAELALAHSRLNLYFGFLRRKTEADASTLPEAQRLSCIAAVEKIIGSCDLMRTAQDVLGHYLALERFFLEESVSKALRLAPADGASSLVDDVFYIARKVIRRSISTGSLDGACAMLNDVAALLEKEVAGALRRHLRSPPPEPLPLAPPAAPHTTLAPFDAVSGLTQRLNRDVETQRMLFLAHMNEAESGAEWSERLATEACSEGEALLLRGTSAPDSSRGRDKLRSCAAGLGAAAAAFRAAHALALAAVTAALKPRVMAWAEAIAQPEVDPDCAEEDADRLPVALDAFASVARAAVSGAAADALLAALVADLAARAEARMLHHRYDREGGLSVERRCRRLAAWAGAGAAAARERCARLTQCGALLALERASHATDALRPAARLAPNDAKDLLARRLDFKIEEIKRLKL